jgi:hypothetical protein
LPSIIIGALYLLVGIVSFIPPFLLGTLFVLSEVSHTTVVQAAPSPGGLKTLEVAYEPSGAYDSGLVSVSVNLKYKRIPFIQRDIYGLGKTNSDQSRDDYVRWVDDSTFYIVDDQTSVDVGLVNFEVPPILYWLYFFVAIVFKLIWDFFGGIING